MRSSSAGSSRTPANRSGSVAAEAVEHGARREGVGERQHLEAVEGAGGALRLGVERAQALDGVARGTRCAPASRGPAGRRRGCPPRRATWPGAETGSSRRYPPSSSASSRISGVRSSPALDRDHARLEQARGQDGPQESRRRGHERAAAARAWPRARRPRGAARLRDGAGRPRKGAGPGAGRASTAPAAPASWASVRRSSVTRSTRRSAPTTTSRGGPETSSGTRRRAGPARPWIGTRPSAARSRRASAICGCAATVPTQAAARPPAGSAGRLGALTGGGCGTPSTSSIARAAARRARPARPPASTSSRPTIASSAQSAPLTRTSGAQRRDHAPRACPRRRRPRGPPPPGRAIVSARSASGTSGRPSPLSARTERSLLSPTTSTSPWARAASTERDVAGVEEVEAAVREHDGPPAAFQARRSSRSCRQRSSPSALHCATGGGAAAPPCGGPAQPSQAHVDLAPALMARSRMRPMEAATEAP